MHYKLSKFEKNDKVHFLKQLTVFSYLYIVIFHSMLYLQTADKETFNLRRMSSAASVF